MSDAWMAIVPLVGRALMHFLWQGALIGVAAALLLATMGRSRPQARYLVGCVAMLLCVLAPVATLLRLSATPAVDGSIVDAVVLHGAALAPTSPGSTFDALMPWLVAVWAGGAVMFGARTLAGLAWIERLRRHARVDDRGMWQARADALAARMRLPRGVTLCFVDQLASPVTAGWWKPVVLMPAALAAQMPVALVEALLAHELAHIRRHDYLVNLMQAAVEALLFYHPVVWWLSRRVRAERELIADALAADVIGEPRRLALALSELSDLHAAAPLPRPALAARGGDLMPRIQNLLRPSTPSAGGRLAVPVIALVGLGLAVYAQAGVAPHAPVAAPAVAQFSPVAAAAPATEVPAAAPVADVAPAPASAAAPAVAANASAAPIVAADAQAAADAASVSLARDPSPVGAAAAPHPATAARDAARSAEYAQITRDVTRAEIGAARTARLAGSINVDDDALTFDRGGRRYRITDPAMVARANAAWRDTNVLGEQMNTLGQRMNERGEAMNRVGQAMQAAANNPERTKAMKDAEARLSRAADEYGRLAAQSAMTEPTAATAARLQSLQAEIDRQSGLIATQARLAAAPMPDLERRMAEASKPMRELQEQMNALEKRMRTTTAVARQQTDALIDEAVSRGLAQPVELR